MWLSERIKSVGAKLIGARAVLERLQPPRFSLGGAALLAILSLSMLASGVLYLTGRPWERGWGWTWQADAMPWKDRLTYAGAVVTAVGAVVALVVSYRKQRDAEEGRFSAQFAAAAAQLGDPAPAVRIAGVYALAALADRYPRQRQLAIDALCGYLRLPYDGEAGRGHLHERSVHRAEGGAGLTEVYAFLPADREVRLTIIRVIRDHLRSQYSSTSWCGRDFDFTGVVFDGGDFRGAVFSGGMVSFISAKFTGGSVSFSDAVFSGGRVFFSGASFSGSDVHFNKTVFSGAAVSFSSAVFSSGGAYFANADFSGGDVYFNGSVFAGGDVLFNATKFSGANVPFWEATFSDGHVSFDEAIFSRGRVYFDGALFSSARVTLNESKFVGGEVTKDGVDFRGWPTNQALPT